MLPCTRFCNCLLDYDCVLHINFAILYSIEWMQKNKLTINLKKPQCMLIGTPQKLSKCRKVFLNVGEIFIENVWVKCAKLLGVYIDECLAWSNNTEVLCRKLIQKLGLLRRLSNFMSKETLLKFYNSVVFPHFNYCCTVWHGAKNKQCMDRLFRLQKRAARIISNIKIPHSVSTSYYHSWNGCLWLTILCIGRLFLFLRFYIVWHQSIWMFLNLFMKLALEIQTEFEH
jgi:hypothetical protein